MNSPPADGHIVAIPGEVLNDETVNLWQRVKPQLETSVAGALATQQGSGASRRPAGTAGAGSGPVTLVAAPRGVTREAPLRRGHDRAAR
jgi:hypothetical protein